MTQTCLNLRKLFGDQYKIRHDESYRAENPEFRKEDEVWLQIIPCQHGHIYPHGDNLLAWSSDRRGPIAKKVREVLGVNVHQDGDDGINATFDVSLFEQVAEIVQPKRKPPKRVLTPEHKAKLAKHWFKSRSNDAGNEAPTSAEGAI